ncbi:MAG: phosphotransferase [Ardenticatenaceae bacterium]|nr:phosphotransferase [Ardenticatenaceae bacterium]
MPMNEWGFPLDLSFLVDDLRPIERLVAEVMGTAVRTTALIGEGFYGKVYRATLTQEPYDVIIKCYKYAHHAQQEAAQLDLLRPAALVTIPHVYAVHASSALFPGEALLMAYLPGQRVGDKTTFPTAQTQANFVESVINNLLAWHNCTNPHGFGPPQGPFQATWANYYGWRIQHHYQQLQQPQHHTVVSDFVQRVAAQSYEALTDILALAPERPSLIHGDYNIWNMLIDPATSQLTAVFDPLDAGWGDYEIDLFHLANGRPDLGLLDHYLQQRPARPGFWLRHHFYWFWDDIKHYLRMGYYEESYFRHKAQRLVEAMTQHLP